LAQVKIFPSRSFLTLLYCFLIMAPRCSPVLQEIGASLAPLKGDTDERAAIQLLSANQHLTSSFERAKFSPCKAPSRSWTMEEASTCEPSSLESTPGVSTSETLSEGTAQFTPHWDNVPSQESQEGSVGKPAEECNWTCVTVASPTDPSDDHVPVEQAIPSMPDYKGLVSESLLDFVAAIRGDDSRPGWKAPICDGTNMPGCITSESSSDEFVVRCSDVEFPVHSMAASKSQSNIFFSSPYMEEIVQQSPSSNAVSLPAKDSFFAEKSQETVEPVQAPLQMPSLLLSLHSRPHSRSPSVKELCTIFDKSRDSSRERPVGVNSRRVKIYQMQTPKNMTCVPSSHGRNSPQPAPGDNSTNTDDFFCGDQVVLPSPSGTVVSSDDLSKVDEPVQPHPSETAFHPTDTSSGRASEEAADDAKDERRAEKCAAKLTVHQQLFEQVIAAEAKMMELEKTFARLQQLERTRLCGKQTAPEDVDADESALFRLLALQESELFRVSL